MALDFIISAVIISLFSLSGGVIALVALNKFQKYSKYALLATLFLTIIIISELMKEGFAVTGFITFSLVAGVAVLYAVKKVYKNQTQFFHEFPKVIAFAASYAIAVDLGQAIAILLSLHYIPQAGLFVLPLLTQNKTKQAFKELAITHFKFIVIGLIAFVIISSLTQTLKAYTITFAAGMMLFIVIEEGLLLKK